MGRRRRRAKQHENGRDIVRIDGRSYPVLDRERIRGQAFLILKRLAPPPRERFLVCDPAAGMRLRLLMVLPDEDSTVQHLDVLRDLRSRQLPEIVNHDKHQDRTRIVLSWTQGIDLGQYFERIERNKVQPPTPFHAFRLLRGIAHGLASLHKHARIIHGDLKPANLIISRKPSHLSLIDFGSAWPIERTAFRSPGDGISVTYAAPEQQIAGAKVDERADQFSASLILYQLLTLKVPFDGLGGRAGVPEFFDAENRCLPPSSSPRHTRFLPRKLWRQIDEVLLKSLAFDPGQRFSTTNEWLNAIESVFLQLQLRESNREQRSGLWDRLCDWLAGSRKESAPAEAD